MANVGGIEIWTPGYWKKEDSAKKFKEGAAAYEAAKAACSQPPWVDLERILKLDPESHPLRIPVVLPNVGWIGDAIIGHGFAPLIRGGAITNYDAIINARAGGKAQDIVAMKLSQTTVASQWSCFYRSGGLPSAGTYSNYPTGAVHNRASAGALPLANPGGSDKKYLLSLGVNHLTGTNVVFLYDILVAAGNISANDLNPLTIDTAALTRYAAAEAAGNMIIADVTTLLGAIASGVNTVTYLESVAGASKSYAVEAMITSGATFRHPFGSAAAASYMVMPLAAGDLGVRQIVSVDLATAMGSGVYAVAIIRPLMLIPTVAITTYVERDSTLQIDGLTELVVGSDSQIGCLAFSVLASTTSTGLQTYLLRTCAG
jgi:hypothetical protein